MRNLQGGELRSGLAKHEPRHDLILGQWRRTGQFELRRVGITPDMQRRSALRNRRVRRKIQRRVDLVLQSLAAEAHAAGRETQLAAGQGETTPLQIEAAADARRIGST